MDPGAATNAAGVSNSPTTPSVRTMIRSLSVIVFNLGGTCKQQRRHTPGHHPPKAIPPHRCAIVRTVHPRKTSRIARYKHSSSVVSKVRTLKPNRESSGHTCSAASGSTMTSARRRPLRTHTQVSRRHSEHASGDATTRQRTCVDVTRSSGFIEDYHARSTQQRPCHAQQLRDGRDSQKANIQQELGVGVGTWRWPCDQLSPPSAKRASSPPCRPVTWARKPTCDTRPFTPASATTNIHKAHQIQRIPQLVIRPRRNGVQVRAHLHASSDTRHKATMAATPLVVRCR